MSLERFIAKRYLISKHKMNFISIITLLSTLGITIGVAALIIVISVFNGFGSLVQSFLMNFDPHIRIEIISDISESETNNILDLLNNNKNVVDYAPFVSGKVLALRDGLTEVINLKGVSPEKANKIYGINESIEFGSGELESNSQTPAIIIGIKLADKLQALVGDTITIISPAGIEKAITQLALPKSQSFLVEGIFVSQNNEYDASLVFTSLPEAQYLLGYGDSFQGFEAKLNNIDYSFKLKNELESILDEKIYSISTWYDFHKELYSVMQIERWVAYILLSLIIAVATFNILGSLTMTVIEKKRDIGVLRSMGVNINSIKNIFMYEGLMIGIIGTFAGLILGYLVCYLQINYNIYPLDPTQYKIDSLPIELRVSDFFFISGVSMLLTFLASYFPAKRAAKVNTIDAIKWE